MMLDSLEDYIKIASNKKESCYDDTLRKSKDLLLTHERKKHCEDYAQKIVEFLIDGKLRTEIFLKTLNFIDQHYYQDVVEERAIIKLCGYPLCGNKIPDMPAKKYHVSTKLNKVYDITERKSFCSNYCYQASNFIKEQIDTSLLWLRTPESYPQFKLLEKSQRVSPGVEIDYGIAKAVPEPVFIPVFSFTEASLQEAEEDEKVDEPLEDLEEKEYAADILRRIEKINVEVIEKLEQEQSEIEQELNDVENIEVCFDTVEENTKSILKQGSESNKSTKKVTFDAPSTSNPRKYDASEVADLQISINTLCRSFNINLNNHTELDAEAEETAKVKVDTDKMNKIIQKVNASNKHKVRQPILIETMHNPEAPKFSKKVAQKIKKPEIDTNLQQIIDKVKTLELSKQPQQKDQDKMKLVLEKIKKKERNKNSTILIDTTLNPEIPLEMLAKLTVKLPIKQDVTVFKVVTNSFLQWFTLETLMFLHGADKVKSILNEKAMVDCFDRLHVSELEIAQQIKYMNICKKLQLQEIAEEKFDNASLGKNFKPLPNYSQLKTESKELVIKANAFYAGTMYEKEDSNFGKTGINDEEGDPAVLPLVDTSTQNALRKKVFINLVTKHVQKHISEMILGENIFQDVQAMIKTFKLEANNVVFKPHVWNVIALVLIHLLAIKENKLKEVMEMSEGIIYTSKVLGTYGNVNEFLRSIIERAEKIDEYVEKYIISIN